MSVLGTGRLDKYLHGSRFVQHVGDVLIKFPRLVIGYGSGREGGHRGFRLSDPGKECLLAGNFGRVLDRQLGVTHITAVGMTTAAILGVDRLPSLEILRGRATPGSVYEFSAEVPQPYNRQETECIDRNHCAMLSLVLPPQSIGCQEETKQDAGENELHFEWKQHSAREKLTPIQKARQDGRKGEDQSDQHAIPCGMLQFAMMAECPDHTQDKSADHHPYRDVQLRWVEGMVISQVPKETVKRSNEPIMHGGSYPYEKAGAVKRTPA